MEGFIWTSLNEVIFMKNILIKYDENDIEPLNVYILGDESFISNVPEDIIKELSEIFNKAVEDLQNERLDWK